MELEKGHLEQEKPEIYMYNCGDWEIGTFHSNFMMNNPWFFFQTCGPVGKSWEVPNVALLLG